MEINYFFQGKIYRKIGRLDGIKIYLFLPFFPFQFLHAIENLQLEQYPSPYRTKVSVKISIHFYIQKKKTEFHLTTKYPKN